MEVIIISIIFGISIILIVKITLAFLKDWDCVMKNLDKKYPNKDKGSEPKQKNLP